MIRLFKVGDPIDIPIPMGMLELNFDPNAERYVVQNRQNMETLWNGTLPINSPAKLRVPFQYTSGFELMVLILDDTGSPAYYVIGNDKVQAQLVDARTVTLNP